jgi:hypothetical protein
MGSTREKKGGGGAEKHKKLRVAVWHGTQEIPVARSRVSRTEKSNVFTTTAFRAVGAVQSALGVGGCGCEIFVLATCSLQFAKAGSAATLPQQEKSNAEELQRGRLIITGFICAVESWRSL